MKKPIETAWNRFEQMVVPANASSVQRSEMRKAFYTGASIVFRIITQGVSEGEEIQDSDLQLLDDIAREVDQFGAELDAAVLGVKRGAVS
jgi:hypothetical protein